MMYFQTGGGSADSGNYVLIFFKKNEFLIIDVVRIYAKSWFVEETVDDTCNVTWQTSRISIFFFLIYFQKVKQKKNLQNSTIIRNECNFVTMNDQ